MHTHYERLRSDNSAFIKAQQRQRGISSPSSLPLKIELQPLLEGEDLITVIHAVVTHPNWTAVNTGCSQTLGCNPPPGAGAPVP